MSNISSGELMIILVIVAIICFIGAAAMAVVLFIWYRKKQAADQAQNAINTAPPPQDEPDASYAAFAPPPASSPIAQGTNQVPEPESNANYNQQTIDLEQPPLSDHVSEFDAIEPMSQPFPKSEIEDIVPQAPLDTLDADPMTDVDAEVRKALSEMDIDVGEIDEIGENDATVLMQRPSRPKG